MRRPWPAMGRSATGKKKVCLLHFTATLVNILREISAKVIDYYENI